MGRKHRPNLTGVPYHLTARIQGHDPFFVGLEQRIVEHAMHCASRSRAQVLAWAVMSNHLHLVAVQGDLPLWRFMQPLLRRIAFDVQLRYGRQGHVFERRYESKPILNAEYLRTVIAYVHLNPVRGGVCESPDAFSYSSHSLYCATADDPVPARLVAAVELTLRIFRDGVYDSLSACRANYRSYLRWRLAADAHTALHGADSCLPGPAEPTFCEGDVQWCRQYRNAADRFSAAAALRAPAAPDMRTIALRVLDEETTPVAALDWLRSGGQTRLLARTRRLVIARCLAAGYANHRIAAFLNVSATTVSKVRATQGLPVLAL